MKISRILTLILLTAFSISKANAQAAQGKPTIIFVHGIFADGTSWKAQISGLQAKGYPVVSVQNPLTSLADDVAATKRAIAQAKGSVILVGHSWGGFVITQAGNDPKVKGLVYVAAIAPDAGESVETLSMKAAPTELKKYSVIYNGFIWLTKEGISTVFAQDVDATNQALIFATQTPGAGTLFKVKSGVPAWKKKPSWFVVAQNDKTMSPDLERLMAKRIKAKTTELPASHVAMISHPIEVLQVIEAAASGK